MVETGNIALSSATGNLGNLITRRFHRTNTLITIDPGNFENRPADVKHYSTDLRHKDCRNIFRRENIKSVIHIGPYYTTIGNSRDSFANAVTNFIRLMDYLDKYNVKKLILISSADLYGASASNAQFMTEESPLLAAHISPLRDIDMMAQNFFWKRPDIETVILRPSHITGDTLGAMNLYLKMDPVIRPMGYDPMIQLVHEEDIIQAIVLALAPGRRGIFNIAGPGPVPLSYIFDVLGKKTIPLPHFLINQALSLKKLAGNKNNATAPSKNFPGEFYTNYLRFVCMVDDSRARKILNYKPQYSIKETIQAVHRWD